MAVWTGHVKWSEQHDWLDERVEGARSGLVAEWGWYADQARDRSRAGRGRGLRGVARGDCCACGSSSSAACDAVGAW